MIEILEESIVYGVKFFVEVLVKVKEVGCDEWIGV